MSKALHRLATRIMTLILLLCAMSATAFATQKVEQKKSNQEEPAEQSQQTDSAHSGHTYPVDKDGKPKYTNALAKETSPYLLQHVHNPVQWYPWTEATLKKAKDEGKVIFLSLIHI